MNITDVIVLLVAVAAVACVGAAATLAALMFAERRDGQQASAWYYPYDDERDGDNV